MKHQNVYLKIIRLLRTSESASFTDESATNERDSSEDEDDQVISEFRKIVLCSDHAGRAVAGRQTTVIIPVYCRIPHLFVSPVPGPCPVPPPQESATFRKANGRHDI